MLIFDNFYSTADAQSFASHVAEKWPRKAIVCADRKEFEQYDIIPVVLVPPIVVVERDEDCKVERAIEASVEQFGGRFAGT